MNSNGELDPVEEFSVEESTSLHNFATESVRISSRFNQQEHRVIPESEQSVNLREFPNADFYYKLVAKVNGNFYSIYDG